ncbi:MAG TPA: hypothetical protein VF640_03795 [Acidimicrobiales bacterium]
MTRRTARALAAGIAAAASIAVPARPAEAHADLIWYFPRWWSQDEVTFTFTAAVPTAARPRIDDGKQSWPTSTERPAVRFASSGSRWGMSCGGTDGRNGIHWTDLPTGAVGRTNVCPPGSTTLTDVEVGFEKYAPWHMGTSAPPYDEYDLWSVATHEFGHALGGWVGPSDENHHFLEDDTQGACPGGTANSTMCQTASSPGAWWKRDVESHDVHTMTNRYCCV